MGAFQVVMRRQAGVLIMVCLAAGVAAAAPTAAIGRLPDTYPLTPLSGEFTITPNAELAALIGSGSPFQSFCLEVYESITVGNTYEALVNDEAILGGGLRPGELPGDAGGDPISPEVAYLYTEFRAGTLSGYDYTPGDGRMASARVCRWPFGILRARSATRKLNVLSPQARAFVVSGSRRGLDGDRFGSSAESL